MLLRRYSHVFKIDLSMTSNLLCSTSKPGIILGMVPGFDIWRMEIDPLIKTLPEAGLGERIR